MRNIHELDEVDTLRFSTAGSVDDGKSTLIGRLLYESHGILEDQLASLAGATIKHGHVPAGEAIDFALLTDGLIAEREQGITIDVAYRYFTTPKRRFIIADTPGHEQYTRNMITGSSTADLTIVLVDAARGISTQSRRHAVIASLLHIPHLVVAINKMDLVGYDQTVFDRLRDEFAPFLAKLNFAQVSFIPISALKGDMLAQRRFGSPDSATGAGDMPWYVGPTLLATLETTTAHQIAATGGHHFRFPVQRVAKTKFGLAQALRGYQGTIAGGSVKVGDNVLVLPNGQNAIIVEIHTVDGALTDAHEEQAVTLVLDRQIELSRGGMLVSNSTGTDEKNAKPYVASMFSANLCWLDPSKMEFGRKYWLKHTSHSTRAVIEKIDFFWDVETLAKTGMRINAQPEQAGAGLPVMVMNEIAQVQISTQQPLMFDAFVTNRTTGCFVLIDDATNRTVAAGMIVESDAD